MKAARGDPAGGAGDGQYGPAEGVIDGAGRAAGEYPGENGAWDDTPGKGPGHWGGAPFAADKLDPAPPARARVPS
jgi:hypothetical protein